MKLDVPNCEKAKCVLLDLKLEAKDRPAADVHVGLPSVGTA